MHRYRASIELDLGQQCIARDCLVACSTQRQCPIKGPPGDNCLTSGVMDGSRRPQQSTVPKQLSRAEELIEAVRKNDEATVTSLLALGGNPNCMANGLTPLVAACENGLVSLCRVLLEAHADPNLVPPSGNYPLRAAIVSGDGECILCMVKSGADVNLETLRGTPLIAASGQASGAPWVCACYYGNLHEQCRQDDE